MNDDLGPILKEFLTSNDNDVAMTTIPMAEPQYATSFRVQVGQLYHLRGIGEFTRRVAPDSG